MFALQFTMKPGEDADGFPVPGGVHVAYFPTPEDRTRFAECPHVASIRYTDEDVHMSDERFYD